MKAKHKARTKTRSKPKTRAKSKTSRTSRARTATMPIPTTTPNLSPDFKTCEEVEVGDIGGVGITTEERKGRGTRCTPRATQPCKSWMRELCYNHYDLLHNDHDNPANHHSSAGPGQLYNAKQGQHY